MKYIKLYEIFDDGDYSVIQDVDDNSVYLN